jgi:hypothetical protein
MGMGTGTGEEAGAEKYKGVGGYGIMRILVNIGPLELMSQLVRSALCFCGGRKDATIVNFEFKTTWRAAKLRGTTCLKEKGASSIWKKTQAHDWFRRGNCVKTKKKRDLTPYRTFL